MYIFLTRWLRVDINTYKYQYVVNALNAFLKMSLRHYGEDIYQNSHLGCSECKHSHNWLTFKILHNIYLCFFETAVYITKYDYNFLIMTKQWLYKQTGEQSVHA